MANYTIIERKRNEDGTFDLGTTLGQAEFVGAKPIRKHYQSAIRSLLDAEGGEVTITISNAYEERQFIINIT